MRIQDMRQEQEVSTLCELERVLSQRYGNDVNAFWISRKGQPPLLLILVSKALANLHFFLPGDHPGFHSVGHVSGLDPDKYTTFFMNSTEEPEEVPNDSVVAFSDALAAAKEFFASEKLPPSVDWFEL
jgi:Immunity protein Imm1